VPRLCDHARAGAGGALSASHDGIPGMDGQEEEEDELSPSGARWSSTGGGGTHRPKLTAKLYLHYRVRVCGWVWVWVGVGVGG